MFQRCARSFQGPLGFQRCHESSRGFQAFPGIFRGAPNISEDFSVFEGVSEGARALQSVSMGFGGVLGNFRWVFGGIHGGFL